MYTRPAGRARSARTEISGLLATNGTPGPQARPEAQGLGEDATSAARSRARCPSGPVAGGRTNEPG